VTSVTLNRLGEREAAAIIARLVGNKELPADVMAEIVERTDGIPLFVEEMTKAVLEAEREGEARRTVAAVPSSALAVPASLHASLMARLDRLGPAKEVAQIGAAIGREFSHALLAAVMAYPRMRAICSNMPSSRTRPMAPCCASRGARFMLASPTPLKTTS
jgi:predicted ATPase